MPDLLQALAGHFVVANLGAGGDQDYPWPAAILPAVTLIEIDGATEPVGARGQYFAHHRLRQIVAGSTQPREFRQRSYWGSSSLLEPKSAVLDKYQLRHLNRVEASASVVPVTLPMLLPTLPVDHLDFLKTDLEGLDFEILQSLGTLLDEVLAVQCEVRTEPLFEGEPYFFEVAHFLYERGFELVGWRPEIWRPAGARQAEHLDGVLVWADALFLTPGAVSRLAGPDLARRRAKHVLLAALLGKKSYGDWLLTQYQAELPAAWQAELRRWLRPTPSFRRGLRLLKRCLGDALFVTPVWPWLRRLRRVLRRQLLSMDHILRSGIDQ